MPAGVVDVAGVVIFDTDDVCVTLVVSTYVTIPDEAHNEQGLVVCVVELLDDVVDVVKTSYGSVENVDGISRSWFMVLTKRSPLKLSLDYSVREISHKPQAVITSSDRDILIGMCNIRVVQSTKAEHTAMEVFAEGGSLLVSLLMVMKIVACALSRSSSDSRLLRRSRDLLQRYSRVHAFGTTLLLVGVPALAITQFWTIFRVQRLQREMAGAVGDANDDDV